MIFRSVLTNLAASIWVVGYKYRRLSASSRGRITTGMTGITTKREPTIIIIRGLIGIGGTTGIIIGTDMRIGTDMITGTDMIIIGTDTIIGIDTKMRETRGIETTPGKIVHPGSIISLIGITIGIIRETGAIITSTKLEIGKKITDTQVEKITTAITIRDIIRTVEATAGPTIIS